MVLLLVVVVSRGKGCKTDTGDAGGAKGTAALLLEVGNNVFKYCKRPARPIFMLSKRRRGVDKRVVQGEAVGSKGDIVVAVDMIWYVRGVWNEERKEV